MRRGGDGGARVKQEVYMVKWQEMPYGSNQYYRAQSQFVFTSRAAAEAHVDELKASYPSSRYHEVVPLVLVGTCNT